MSSLFLLTLPVPCLLQSDLIAHIRRLYRLANVTLTEDDIVVVNEFEAIRNISYLITQGSPRVLQNYMIWRFLIHRIPNMPKRFRMIFARLKKAALGINNEPSRMMTCVDHVNDNMGFAVSKLYLNRYYDRTARNEVYLIQLHIELIDEVVSIVY